MSVSGACTGACTKTGRKKRDMGAHLEDETTTVVFCAIELSLVGADCPVLYKAIKSKQRNRLLIRAVLAV